MPLPTCTAPPPAPAAQVLPRVAPCNKTTELLVAQGTRGGAKRSVGAVIQAEGVHPDGRSLHISLQGAESTERPGRCVRDKLIVGRSGGVEGQTGFWAKVQCLAAGRGHNRQHPLRLLARRREPCLKTALLTRHVLTAACLLMQLPGAHHRAQAHLGLQHRRRAARDWRSLTAAGG